ncbi:GMC oxidoreductase [Epithele typhae]|uniref:GMC oxidoreductase n=1 Tax=Epithele typhae TaxID=378194 RepID=UPI00200760EF|nr:GMC oxidoreductase [Epithele typhae]KAH9912095.1 GMC oxidoreductase [Epithele typhae]
MRSFTPLLLSATLCVPALASFAPAHDHHARHLHANRELRKRNIVSDSSAIATEYDFVIVGGGTAGLAIAARLSEDSNTTVLVLEAGDTGDAVADQVNIPDNAYLNGLTKSSYDWGLSTVNQANAQNRAVSWPRGKLLGGSSAVNGMFFIRGDRSEYDAWAQLAGDGGEKWNWESMLAVMQESETYTPPEDDVRATANIVESSVSRGKSGPIHASYPGFMIPSVGNWTQTLGNIGVKVSADGYSGDGSGAYLATSAINPETWTRSYSRSGYIDPLPVRSNLAILADAMVTRVIFDTSNKSNLTATGVEFAKDASSSKTTVSVRKEVILTGGTVGSPAVLMHSGVGPSDVLQSAGVDVLLDLPGVGQHLQDHISTYISFQTTSETIQGLMTANASLSSDAKFRSFVNSAIAYVNVTDLLGDSATEFHQTQSDALASARTSLVPSSDSTVQAGYAAIYNQTLNSFLLSTAGQVEILYSTMFAGGVVIQAALQHPFSQGRIYITNTDPFTAPAIDPRYLSHPADVVILREGLKLARKIAQTAPLSSAIGTENAPTAAITSDADWDAYIAGSFGTSTTPAGLASARVRTAEQAAKIIRATYNGVGWPSSAVSNGHSTTTTTKGSNSTNNTNTNGTGTDDAKSGASAPAVGSGPVLLAAAAAVAALFL